MFISVEMEMSNFTEVDSRSAADTRSVTSRLFPVLLENFGVIVTDLADATLFGVAFKTT